MISGYVLINTAKGKALEVAEKVAELEGVCCACSVTGTFDVIATFEVEKLEEIGDVVCKRIHALEGVCCTQTAICVKCCPSK